MIAASPRRLQVFKAVVDLGGFNAAAAHLGIAQPSVGAHVKALESEARQTLLQRHRGAKPKLTKAGRAIYELAVDVTRRSEETSQRLAGLRAGQSREITLAGHRDLALSFLPERLARFARENAKARVVTRIGTIEDVLEMVQSGAVQLGVLLAAAPIRGIHSELLGREALEFIVSPTHPLASKTGVSLPELLQYPFVTGLRDSRYFRIVDRALRSIGLADYSVSLELQESSAVKEAVRHGNVIGCLPASTVRRDVESGMLAVIRTETKLPKLQIRCVHAAPPNAALRRLITVLQSSGTAEDGGE